MTVELKQDCPYCGKSEKVYFRRPCQFPAEFYKGEPCHNTGFCESCGFFCSFEHWNNLPRPKELTEKEKNRIAIEVLENYIDSNYDPSIPELLDGFEVLEDIKKASEE